MLHLTLNILLCELRHLDILSLNQTRGGLGFSYTHYGRIRQSTQSLYKRWNRQVQLLKNWPSESHIEPRLLNSSKMLQLRGISLTVQHMYYPEYFRQESQGHAMFSKNPLKIRKDQTTGTLKLHAVFCSRLFFLQKYTIRTRAKRQVSAALRKHSSLVNLA